MAEDAVEEEEGEDATAEELESCDEARLAEEMVGVAVVELRAVGRNSKDEDEVEAEAVLLTAANNSGDGAWKVRGTVGLSQALVPSG